MNSYSGTVTSAELCSPQEGVRVTRYDLEDNIQEDIYSDSLGCFNLTGIQTGDYIIFQKEDFISKKYHYNHLPKIVRLLEDKLIGYQKKLWFRPGEHIEVYIHSSQEFSLKLYRHGLYKTLILDFGRQDACKQNVSDDYFVECGLNWQKTFEYEIPEAAVPGLYSLLLESEGQQSFALPFIVSTPQENYGKTSKLLYLASTNTWQSYNIWGGRSRYRNFEDGNSQEFELLPNSFSTLVKGCIKSLLPMKIIKLIRKISRKNSPETIIKWKFKKLTIKRPFTNCDLEGDTVFEPFTNHLAGGEWRLLAWLEREQIQYEIVSGYELHQNPKLLENYDAIILSTHCEYWSREMYEGLKHFHENRGLWIINLSGNTMYRQIEFYDDGSTRCISLSFQKSCADETQLLGVRYTDEGYATCAPYKIVLPEHWIYKGVNHNKNKYFGSLSLNQNTNPKLLRYDPGRPGSGQQGLEYGLEGLGASGWETDKISKTAPKDIKVIAKGLNKKGGADMSIREPMANRGGMFTASSLVFGACLLIDHTASLMVNNLITRALKKDS
ncbi:MAG: hypothetical protein P4L59_07625 [Desulfosporosinus sp.]|nr:hypothetical protein [Desulfosporosinus sp.]